jgi:hypothetical protein
VASLRILGEGGSERVVELGDRKVQIGRSRENDIVLPDSQKGVSRTHAELRYENGRYIIVDLQSQNGTWLNGQRIERAEVPPDSEIAVGEYRLRFEDAPSKAPTSGSSTAHLPIDDMILRERTKTLPDPIHPAAPAAQSARSFPGGVVGIAFVILVIAVVWMLMPRLRQTAGSSSAAVAEPTSVSPPEPAPPARIPATDLPALAQPIEAPATNAATRRADPSVASNAPKPPARRATGAVPEWSPTGIEVSADLARVQRKPGESTEGWRTRGAALHTRYAYSKQALDRGDYAAAAGGFEAILMEEPGFLDAPQLLVQAHAGLRISARDLYDAGNKLDAVGDWMGALQKYDQARLIHSGVPGLLPAMKRVREKLQLAGTRAFTQARQLEASGRPADAVKEYEKAFQWLSADDPNREIARTRVDQLKRHD